MALFSLPAHLVASSVQVVFSSFVFAHQWDPLSQEIVLGLCWVRQILRPEPLRGARGPNSAPPPTPHPSALPEALCETQASEGPAAASRPAAERLVGWNGLLQGVWLLIGMWNVE